ncbi:MAG: T9SS type A sorting domain-containing protein [Bacteroidetes bacterium]|nr:T9SS type A sorting domain-containing protein [Bacteroidota bacterium]
MKSFYTLVSILISGFCFCQTTFQRTIGDSGIENAPGAASTHNNNIIIAGFTNSFGAGKSDCYVVSINENGDTLFTRTYGGADIDEANMIIETADHGFLLAAETYSFGAGQKDGMIIKTDSAGELTWTKVFGNTGFDEASAVVQTKDGNYLIAGSLSVPAGSDDILLLKIDQQGDTLWTKIISGSGWDYANDVVELNNSDLIFCGYTSSFSGTADSDLLIFRTDKNGAIKWCKTYGNSGQEKGGHIHLNRDSTLTMTGWTMDKGKTDMQAVLLKTDLNGNILWSRTYAGSGSELIMNIVDLPSGDFFAMGITDSYGAGNFDGFLFRAKSNGDTLWSKTYGGKDLDMPFALFYTSDNGLMMTGGTSSFKDPNGDLYIVKTDTNGVGSCNQSSCPLAVASAGFSTANVTFSISSGVTYQTVSPVFGNGGGSIDDVCVTAIDNRRINTPFINLYPNPFSSSCTIELSNGFVIKEIYLYNTLGQKLNTNITINGNIGLIQRDDMVKGLYLLSVTDMNGLISAQRISVE